MRPSYAVIGGSGLDTLAQGFRVETRNNLDTPYGDVSSELITGKLNGRDIVFLARHGTSHQIPPHKINYRANLWALHEIGSIIHFVESKPK